MQDLNREQVKNLIDSQAKVVIVETLSKEDFDAGHLPGALSMPADKVMALAPDQLKDKNAKIITYCASAQCPASRRAAETLEKLGYTDVAAYTAGKEDWKNAGLPLEGRQIVVEKTDVSDEVPGEAAAVSTTTTDDIENARHGDGNGDVDHE